VSAEALWDEIAPVNAAILEHPFLAGLADGTLPGAAFERYLVQDALFLDDYARALALCGARAASTPELRTFCRHAAEAIDVERDLHERLLGELGASAAGAEPSPTCLGYGAFLLQACALRDRHEALGAVAPCYWIYREVGAALAAAGSPEPRYAAWIATYGGEEFDEAARAAVEAAGRALEGLDAPRLASALRHARVAARYEWMFWDAAWRGEEWGPRPLPSPS
jgi:thiaminase/transcriptional activator TenA